MEEVEDVGKACWLVVVTKERLEQKQVPVRLGWVKSNTQARQDPEPEVVDPQGAGMEC